MCLIVYSPKGELMDRAVFDYARKQNSDGIGIMSEYGVSKYLGKKAGKKAWRELKRLSNAGAPWGLHLRWATHGQVIKSLCHPFHAPGSDNYVMHNGVITQMTQKTTDWASDTLLYVATRMRWCPNPSEKVYKKYYDGIEDEIGFGNKLLIYHTTEKAFTICNEQAGDWIDGFWYSNTYSLPESMNPWQKYLTTDSYMPPVGGYFPANGSGSTNISNDPSATVDPLPRAPKLLGYYEGIEADPDANGYFDDGTEIGEKAAAYNGIAPTAEDKAWLRNQQLSRAVDASADPIYRYHPLDRWHDENEWRDHLKRISSKVNV